MTPEKIKQIIEKGCNRNKEPCPNCGKLNHDCIYEDGMRIDGRLTYSAQIYECPCGCVYKWEWDWENIPRMVKMVTKKFFCFTWKTWEEYKKE